MSKRRRQVIPSGLTFKINIRPALERFVFVYVTLKERGHVSAAEISARFEVCEKTAWRDLSFMRDRLGYSIEYDPSVKGWRGHPPEERIL